MSAVVAVAVVALELAEAAEERVALEHHLQ